MQVNVSIWWAREWSCDEQQQSQFCERKQALVAPESLFTRTMYTWLRRGEATLQFHAGGLVNCSAASAADAPEACADAAANCVFGRNYCLDPHASSGGGPISGQDALLETLRTSCVNQVRSKDNAQAK